MELKARRAVRFTFEIGIPASTSPTSVWVPRPINNAWQQERGCLLPELAGEEGVDPETTNRMVRFTVPASQATQKLEVSFDIERRLRAHAVPDAQPFAAPVTDTPSLARYLVRNRKVPLDGPVAEQARLVGTPGEPPVLLARRGFEHLLKTLAYDSGGCTPERADQLGDLYTACDLRTGTCTEFHGLFVGFMRVLHVPARFNFGFNLPRAKTSGAVRGYHCWSEVYLPGAEWFPVDVSEAIKREDNRDFYFGSLDADRVAFTWDRDVTLSPRQSAGPVDKFIFPYAESAGAPVTPELGFRFQDL